MTDKKLVLTSCSSIAEARKLAHQIVERQLAACVNVVPHVESIYRWEGNIETAAEFLLLIKTTEGAFEQLRDTLIELHSYENPECIKIAIEDGSADYLRWIGESVR